MKFDQFPSSSEKVSTPQAAQEVLRFVEAEMPRLSPDDFADVIPQAEIDLDKKALETLKGRFHDDLLHLTDDERVRVVFGQQVSRALESTIAYHVPAANWFGDGTEFVRPSEFDDVIHGIDGVVEFQAHGVLERLALGIDASRNVQRDAIEKKVARNIKTLLSEASAADRQVKYFASNITDERGPLKDIVPVVIGVENASCDDLIKTFAEKVRLLQKKPRSSDEQARLTVLEKQLAEHPAQFLFLSQMEMQLRAYDYILGREKQNDRRQKLHTKIAALMEIVKEIQSAKRRELHTHFNEQLDQDSVTRVLREVFASHQR